jgi:mRNA-degrading endonuclease RelE of RelBE toxin-antitoxin system
MDKRPKSVPKPYEIEISSSAEITYLAYKDRAEKALERGDATNSHITAFNMIRDAFRAIQANPTDRKYALAGNLACVYRIKKGRMRICYIVSTDESRACILFISETLRKEGDARDPYALFTKMVMSGKFSDLFAELGVALPDQGCDYRIQ